MSHTPTPWHRNIPPAAKYNTIWSGRNTHVLHLDRVGLSEEEVEANAEFIIRACNNHDKLVEALSNLLDCVDGNYKEVADKCRAALALARGEAVPNAL